MNNIEISVVMSVYNEEETLTKTVQSILNQDDVSFEFIIVNDGSSDASAEILNAFAEKDDRVKIIAQQNKGLTKSLIHACDLARGTYIARQDAGDWSLAGRLRSQLDLLNSHPAAVLCSTGTRYFSQRGELLMEQKLTVEAANKGLEAATLESIIGPSHHGCTMFKRSSYLACGGYRAEFKVAQDLDLWTRLASIGEHVTLQEIYYEAVLRKSGISSNQRARQEITRQHIFECTQMRKKIGNDEKLTEQLQDKLALVPKETKNDDIDYDYFVGSILFKRDKPKSRYYFKSVLKQEFLHYKALGKLLLSYLPIVS